MVVIPKLGDAAEETKLRRLIISPERGGRRYIKDTSLQQQLSQNLPIVAYRSHRISPARATEPYGG